MLLRSQGWIPHHGLPLGKEFFDQLPQTDAPAELARAGRPLLVFHGSGDAEVPIEHGRAYEEAMRNAGVETRFEVIEAEDHAMRSVAARETIVSGSVAWLRRFLHPDAAADSTA
jgi:acetyl esterase/lipase